MLLDLPFLPQIQIGSTRAPASPRIQVALLAQLLASLLDEVREGISGVVSLCTSLTSDDLNGASRRGFAEGETGRGAADLLRLAEEGVCRDEAALKGQLLAMTQLLS